MAKFLRYDVFSGSPTNQPVWLESAEDLDLASQRMAQLSRSDPGPYFVYSCRNCAVVTQVDTSVKTRSA